MTPPDKSNLTNAALHSRRQILQLLRNGPLSRRQLTEMTGLHGSTMTYIVRDLLESNIIRNMGKRASNTVGKKQVLLEVNPSRGWVAGLGISTDWGFITYLDMAGNVLEHDYFEIDHDLPHILGTLGDRITDWGSRRDKAIGKMLGVGVGIPGIVDTRTGQVVFSSMLKLHKYSIGSLLAKQFNTHVRVDNNVNFAAVAEGRIGCGVPLKNFIYILLHISAVGGFYDFISVGSTHYVGGKLDRGAHFAAGEVHQLVREIVSVERYSAEEVLLMGQAEADMTEGLHKLAIGTGRTLAILCDLFDPEAVIIGSNTAFCNKRLFDLIESELNRGLVPVPDRHIPVLASELGDHGVAMGAAFTVLDRALSSVEDGVLSGIKSE